MSLTPAHEDGSRLERLVLFDIDGTLLECGRQTRPPFAAALTEVFGTTGDLDGYEFSGCTDPQAVLELMTAAGFSAAEVKARLPRMRELYLAGLEGTLDRRGMRLLPGAAALLEGLASRADLALALLTGNWEPGARTKLSRFDLNRFFAFGAFGCDGIRRSELPPVALARAADRLERRFRPDEALIVGDSVHDISCGHDHGIPVLAVATGRTPAQALRSAGADWVVPDLAAARQLLPWLGG
ncbi:MAG TPA: HAD family hydrolase [Thermoanaerobaculia bacterium]|nr:HAD family hydrolase [Thermoanaerobaculia bacterium]